MNVVILIQRIFGHAEVTVVDVATLEADARAADRDARAAEQDRRLVEAKNKADTAIDQIRRIERIAEERRS